MALYGYVLVEAVISVPFNEMSTCENRLCRNRLTGPKAASAGSHFGFHIQHGVSKVYVIFSSSANVEFYRGTVRNCRHGVVFDQTALFRACLSRWDGKQIKIRTLCTRTTFREQTTSCKYVAWSSSLYDALLLKAGTRLTTHALHGLLYTFRHALFSRLFQRLSAQHVVCYFHYQSSMHPTTCSCHMS